MMSWFRMLHQKVFIASAAVWGITAQGVVEANNSTAPAFNPKLSNTLDNAGGPTLFYNGSGPVPAIGLLSPPPEPLPKLT